MDGGQVTLPALRHLCSQRRVLKFDDVFISNGIKIGQGTGNFANPGLTQGLRGRKRDATEGGK